MAGIEGMSVEQVQALAELAQGLSSDPKTRQGFLHLTKMKNPDVAIPEIDIPNSMRAAFAAPFSNAGRPSWKRVSPRRRSRRSRS